MRETASEYGDLVERAKNLSSLNYRANNEEVNLLTNKLLKDYINRTFMLNNKDFDNHTVAYNIDMILPLKNITENKAFFDELFRKNGIDYVV